jgi:hypothetical protein
MTYKEKLDFASGKHEVELTDDLINQIVKDQKWDIKALKEMREMGAKWNTERNSIVISENYK